MAQASADSFSREPCGHKFVLRTPLAKATANRCAVPDCGLDIRAHARDEVTDEQLLAVLNAQDDGRASTVLPGELAVGSYKAALAACRDPKNDAVAVINTAGQKLHAFMPLTRAPFDKLRNETPPRLLDVEWEDSEGFTLPLCDIEHSLAWAREHVAAGRMILINCAQGKSRSGTMAVAYMVAKLKLSVDEALTRVQARRAIVQPNPTFMRALRSFEPELLKLPAPVSATEARLRAAFAAFDADKSGGLNANELRKALIDHGHPANGASRMLADYDAEGSGELSVDEFVQAWEAEGLQLGG